MIRLARCLALLLLCLPSVSQAGTIEDIKARGAVNCAVQDHAPPYSSFDQSKQWQGLAIDFCRALASAVLGNGKLTGFIKVEPQDAIATLQAEDADVLLVEDEWNTALEINHGLSAVAPLWLLTDGKRGVWIVVRQGDESWGLASKLVLSALLVAEFPDLQKQMQELISAGATLGMPPNWSVQAVSSSGHFADMIKRHFGEDVARGPNQLYSKGGVHVFP
jgi:hypothetical protein